MIFLCVGSREYQFDRLIKEVDDLVRQDIITDVYGQIGATNYEPKNFEFKHFLSSEEFEYFQNKADLIISHGGTGALINALKKGKQVISVPRLAKFKEHTDDHQLQVSRVLKEEGFLLEVLEIEELKDKINEIKKNPITKTYNRPSQVLNIIDDYLKNEL